MDEIAIGVACFGTQHPEWWSKLVSTAASAHHYNIDIGAIIQSNTMATDSNRNAISENFLSTKFEWILWIDTDNYIPTGGVRRLLDVAKGGKSIVSGLYHMKTPPYATTAMFRRPDGMYQTMTDWNRGEIIPVDACGMGAVIIHRSVFEDIQKNFIPVRDWNGGLFVVHKDDIKGELVEDRRKSMTVIHSVLHNPIHKTDPEKFPFFYLQYCRTEDMVFYENAQRVGHQAWVDTSVEVPHQKLTEITGSNFREENKPKENVILTEYL